MATAASLDPVIARLVQTFYEDLDSPRSLACYLLVKYGEWEQLTGLRFRPHDYATFWPEGTTGDTVNRVRRDYQATELLRKAQFLPIDPEGLEEKARNTWIDCERQNKRAALQLEPFRSDALGHYLADEQFARVRKFLICVKKRIRNILGKVPDQIEPSFGPGSVYESAGLVQASELVVLDKLDRLQPHVTPAASQLFHHYWRSCLWYKAADWPQAMPQPSNCFATVPKTASTLRCIAVEPGGNLWLQKGIGKHIRGRLQRIGLLLPEGKSERNHHRAAQVGSLDDSIATIDLSNASDTLSNALVQMLLPDEWYELLSSCRCASTEMRGKGRFILEKFSSMGNGFTFELETLIFYALAKEVGEQTGATGLISAYGDDVIVPAAIAADVVALFRLVGFIINTDKTYVQGCFRESCGGDFYAGQDVAPFRLKRSPERPEDWIAICNGIHRSWDREIPGDPGWRAWKIAHSQIPKMIRRCQSSPEYGDVAVHWKEPRMIWSKDLHAHLPLLISRPAVRLPMERHSPDAILCYALLGGDPEGPSPRRRSTQAPRLHLPKGGALRARESWWAFAKVPHMGWINGQLGMVSE